MIQNAKKYYYTLDFSDCSSVYEAYRTIDRQFDLPIQCGENLNAFWDVLTGFIGRPAQITVCRKQKTKKQKSFYLNYWKCFMKPKTMASGKSQ